MRRHLKIGLLKTVYYSKASIIRYAIYHINICRFNAFFQCYRYAICWKKYKNNHLYIYIYIYNLFYRCRHGSVGIVNSLRVEWPKIRVSIPGRGNIYFLLQIPQTEFWAHPPSLSTGGLDCFSESWAARAWSWPLISYLAPAVKISQLQSHFMASHKKKCSVCSLLGSLTIQFITKNCIGFKGSVIIISVHVMKKIKRSVEGRKVQKLTRPAFRLYTHSCNVSHLHRGKFVRAGNGTCIIKRAKLESVTKRLDKSRDLQITICTFRLNILTFDILCQPGDNHC